MSESQPEVQTSPNVEAKGVEVTAEPSPTKEETLARVSVLSAELRRLILDIKKLPRDKTLSPHLEEVRCLSEAQTLLQTGLMWMRRAINPIKEF